MSKLTPIYNDGEYQGHFKCTGTKPRKMTLKEQIQRAKRARRDARLVNFY